MMRSLNTCQFTSFTRVVVVYLRVALYIFFRGRAKTNPGSCVQGNQYVSSVNQAMPLVFLFPYLPPPILFLKALAGLTGTHK